MRPGFISTSLLLALTVSVGNAMARGGGGGAPHMAAAPRMAAPRMAAPRMAAPRMAAPRMPAMRMAAPRMAAPRMQAHMAQPRMQAPHIQAAHMQAPHMQAAHMPQMHAPNMHEQQMHAAHMPEMRGAQAHMPENRGAENHMANQHSPEQRGPEQHAAEQHGLDPHTREGAKMAPGQQHMAGAENNHIDAAQQRQMHSQEAMMERHGVDPHAAHMAEMQKFSHPQAVNEHSAPQIRNEHENAIARLEGKKGGLNAGHVAAGALGGAALAGFAAHQMHENQMRDGQMHDGQMHNGEIHGNQAMGGEHNNPEHNNMPGQRNLPGGGELHGGNGRANVPPAPVYANPRRFDEHAHAQPEFHKEPAGRLAYHAGVPFYPRAGDKRKGIPGVYDPGAYLRTPHEAHTRINEDYARHQIERLHNWRQDMDTNRRNFVSDRSRWPWHLPQQRQWYNPSTWFGGGGGNGGYNVANTPASPYAANPWGGNPNGYNPPLNLFGAYGNPFASNPYAALSPYYGYGGAPLGAYWNNFNNYDGWNNFYGNYANVDPGYYNGGGILGALGSLFGSPQGVGIGTGGPNDWMNNLLYAENYSVNGQSYPAQYFAMNGYVPTPYVFSVADGQFWQPGTGYSDYLPPNYQDPITVNAQEVVPQFDGNGNITGYAPQTFYYDSYYDDDAQAYGYYDYRKRFHWAKLPGIIARVEGAVAQ